MCIRDRLSTPGMSNKEIVEAIRATEKQDKELIQFLALAKKYTDFSELTTPMINEFVDKRCARFINNDFRKILFYPFSTAVLIPNTI